jgi:hypothetical protein
LSTGRCQSVSPRSKAGMIRYEFYEIRSKKSLQFVDGLRQVSLICADTSGLHIFLWLDEDDNLKHLQFLFNERLIEWFSGRDRLLISRTNRSMGPSDKTGIHKGVRTIHAIEDDDVLKEGLKIMTESRLPHRYSELIKRVLRVTAATGTDPSG